MQIIGFKTGKMTTDRRIKHLITKVGETHIPYRFSEYNTRNGQLDDTLISNHYEKLEWNFEHGHGPAKYVWWGFLRNTKTIMEKANKRNYDWYFVDHPYFFHKTHSDIDLGQQFIRIVKNGINQNKIVDINEKKLEQYEKIHPQSFKISDWKKGGKHIVLLPPSFHMCRFFDIDRDKLINDTINKIKEHTDRPIDIRIKKKDGEYNPNPISNQFENAHAVVAYQSNGAIKAILQGIPSFVVTPEYSACTPVSETDLSKIETPYYANNRREWLANLCNNQFSEPEYKRSIEYLDGINE